MARQKRFVLDALTAKENKAASSVYGSSSLAPPPKRRQLIRAGIPEGEKDVESIIAANNIKEVPHYGAILPLSPPVDHPTRVN